MKIFLPYNKCQKKQLQIKNQMHYIIWFMRIHGKLISAAICDKWSLYKLRLLHEIQIENILHN